MDKVFRVELSGNKDRCCELELPAAYYSLLDALDKLQMAPGDKPRWEFRFSMSIWLMNATSISSMPWRPSWAK